MMYIIGEWDSCTYLINGQNLPLDITQLLRVAKSQLVGRQQHVQLEFLVGGPELKFTDDLARRSSADVSDHVNVWCPGLKLPLPRGDGRERDDHQEGSILVQLVEKVGQERNGLHSLGKVISPRDARRL
jgi:hypothetical protein